MIHTTADTKYSYRTPLYQRLKGLNEDIISFHQYSRGKKYVPDPKLEARRKEDERARRSPTSLSSDLSLMMANMSPSLERKRTDFNKKHYTAPSKTVASCVVTNMFWSKQANLENVSPLNIDHNLQKR